MSKRVAFLPTIKNGILVILFFCVFIYLVIPTPDFPNPPANSPQSQEPRDVENSKNLRAYFTNLSRDEIISHYRELFHHPKPFQFLPSLQLNYPPEEAEWYVYNPIKTSYLEETVFPLRESIFINAYTPKESEDKIAFQGQVYQTKITIRYYQSSILTRIIIALLSVLAINAILQIATRLIQKFLGRN